MNQRLFQRANPRPSPGRNEGRVGRSNSETGISLVEVMVAVGIIFLIFAVSVPFYVRARNQSRTVHCMGNVRGLGHALSMYVDIQEGALPAMGASLISVLGTQIADPNCFRCPLDNTPGPDSYTGYYAARKKLESSDSYLLGCGRHDGFKRSVCLLLDFTTTLTPFNTRAEQALSGKRRTLYPGDRVAAGTMTLADGTSVTLTGGKLRVELVQSFLLRGGPYHVLRIPLDSFGTVDAKVSSGARFDLLTPSANIRAAGGSFSVETGLTFYEGRNTNYSLIRVSSGKVEAAPILRGRISELAVDSRRTIMGPPFVMP